MSSNSPHMFYNVIHTLIDNNIPLENLIHCSLIKPGVANSGFMNNFISDLPHLLEWLARHDWTWDVVQEWMKQE
jgi:hypothetical protein